MICAWSLDFVSKHELEIRNLNGLGMLDGLGMNSSLRKSS